MHALSARRLLSLLTAAALSISCAGGGTDESGNSTGDLIVAVATNGADLDADGYQVAIDLDPAVAVGANASHTFEGLTSGPHLLLITGIAANCTLVGDNPRNVGVVTNQETTVNVVVNCAAITGSALITVSTTGLTQDQDGYQVTVDGGTASNVAVNGTRTLAGLTPGAHTVSLSGIAANCTIQGSNPITVNVTSGAQAAGAFTLTCVANLKNRIVFSSTRGTPGGLDDIELWSMNPDGSDPLRITNNSVIDGGPTVSPDGSRIAFLRGAFGTNAEIWVAKADGSDAVQVTSTNEAIWSVDWSPNGQRLLFARRLGLTDVYDLVVIDPDGGNEVVIGPTDPGRTIRRISPRWSPDGLRIAFGTDSSLNTIAADGSDEQVVYPHVISSVSWAAQGNRLVFNSAEGPAPAGAGQFGTTAFVIQPNGQGLVPVPTTTANTEYGAPAWSPDGQKLVFSRHLISSGGSAIWVAQADGSNAFELAGLGAINGGPAWR